MGSSPTQGTSFVPGVSDFHSYALALISVHELI